MMRKNKLYLAVGVIAVLSASCGTAISETTQVPIIDSKTTMTVQTTQNIGVNETQAPQVAEEISTEISTDVPEDIANILELGTYENHIALNGEKRDEADMEEKNGSLIFPQCSIRSIVGSTMGTETKFVDISEEKVKKLVGLLEEAEAANIMNKNVNFAEYADADDFELNAYLTILLLNSKGEYKTIVLTAFKGDMIDVRVYGEKEEGYRIFPNKELTDMVKELTEYRQVKDKDLKKITEIEVTYTIDENGETMKEAYQLTKEEIEQAKESFIERKREHECSIAGLDTIITAKTSDNQVLRMRMYERMNLIAMEGELYSVPEKLVKLLMKGKK